jgi:hypothetical protein
MIRRGNSFPINSIMDKM